MLLTFPFRILVCCVAPSPVCCSLALWGVDQIHLLLAFQVIVHFTRKVLKLLSYILAASVLLYLLVWMSFLNLGMGVIFLSSLLLKARPHVVSEKETNCCRSSSITQDLERCLELATAPVHQ